MRYTFIVLRLLGYGSIVGVALVYHLEQVWWQWLVSLLIAVWGIGDQWKRPDDSIGVLRRGAWAEMLLILIGAFVLQNSTVLFLLTSPLSRTCVHLKWRDCAGVLLFAIGIVVGVNHLFSNVDWMELGQLGALVALGMYSYVLGMLVRERDKARRLVTVVTFEREQRLKDEERIRIATQLHDVMGQYWTAVVRALDVAVVVEGEQRLQFVVKAQEAAMQGLQEMRVAVHDWHEGRQTPDQWMAYVEAAMFRVREFVGLEMRWKRDPINWHRFEEGKLVAEVLARTILESVTNAIRHGAATSIRVHVRSDEQAVTVLIQDDGIGMRHGEWKERETGIGVLTMRKLAESVCGEWQMESKRGHGVSVRLTVPYQLADLSEWIEKGGGSDDQDRNRRGPGADTGKLGDCAGA